MEGADQNFVVRDDGLNARIDPFIGKNAIPFCAQTAVGLRPALRPNERYRAPASASHLRQLDEPCAKNQYDQRDACGS